MNQIPLNVYNEVYEDARKKLLSFSFSIVKDSERAEYVVQEKFKKFLLQD
jgi:hypothetical protein